jgi:alpha-beta hydrolase superfamily lysophospholipase
MEKAGGTKMKDTGSELPDVAFEENSNKNLSHPGSSPHPTDIPQSRFYTSLDDEKVFYRYWDPKQGSFSAIVCIIHGMAEHSERYDTFAVQLADALHVRVLAVDLRGHGRTACPESDSASLQLGVLRKGEKARSEDAVTLMSRDVIGVIGESMGSADLPIVLLGHSMGSVVARAVLKNATFETLKRIKGVILSGVPTPPSAVEVYPLMLVGDWVKRTGLGGEFVRRNFIAGKFDYQLKSRLRLKRVENNSFISSDPEEVQKFNNGKLTNHLVDPDIMISVVKHLRALRNPSSYFQSLKGLTLPFLFVSGRDDPVCMFGATSSTEAQHMRSIGQSVLEIYVGNARHEFIHEIEPVRSETVAQVFFWIANKLK